MSNPTLNPSVLARWVVVGLNLVLPVVFYRQVLDSFDLTKATILWIVGASLVVFVATNFQHIRWSRSELVAVVVLIGALGAATATSVRPWSSIFGQYQRYAGLLTYLSLGALFLVVAHEFDALWQRRSIFALRAAAFLCATYVLLQSLDLDPWNWSSPGQNKPLFGTMGNINTSSGLLGTVAPLFLVGVMSPKSKIRRAGSVFGFVYIGGVIGLNESFQGNVAGLVSVLILLAAACLATHLGEVVLYLALAAVFLLAGIQVNSNGEFAGLALIGLVLSIGSTFTFNPASSGPSLLCGTHRRLALTSVGAVVSLVVVVLTLGNRVASEVRGGMSERAAFYRSAFELWRDRPFLGYGPETFGFLYSIHRPEWHALRFEANRPSSAHSIPFGLLASGGIVVFVAFVVFSGLVLRRGIVGMRRTAGEVPWTRICVGGAFVASLVQSLVSVEHIALLMVFFTLAGLTVAESRINDLPSRPGRRRRPVRSKSLLTFGLMLVVPLALIPQLSRPFRADLSVRRGLEAAYRDGDVSGGLERMKDAVAIAPWDPQQLLREVTLLQEIGDAKALAPEAIRLSEKFNCLPSVSVGAAYAAAAIGDFTKASEVGRCTVEHDPYSVEVKKAVAELNAQMAEASLRASKRDVAIQFTSDALSLDPDNQRALVVQGSLSSTPG